MELTDKSLPDSNPKVPDGEAYCGNCGYSFIGLTDSTRCPECGQPVVDVLMRKQFATPRGRRYRSKATLFGWPVIDVAWGPSGGQRRGVARGIIAMGDIAIGGIAVGGVSFGLVSVGAVAVGGFAVGGGIGIGVLSSIGANAAALGWAMGANAAGALALGVNAAGIVAVGLNVAAFAARGLRIHGNHYPNLMHHLQWLLGTSHTPSFLGLLPAMLMLCIPTVLTAGLIGLVASRKLKQANAP